jgi:hypothetical protein
MKHPGETMWSGLKMLNADYMGDPLNIFTGINNFESARKRLIKFKGLGTGTATLLIKNYIRFGYISLENPHDMPIKIDRHAIKISVGNGVVKIPEGSKVIHRHRFEKILRGAYREACRENELDPIALDDMKWIVGAYYCRKRSTKACKTHCPLDCEQLVQYTRGTYVHYPSERRRLDDSFIGTLF